MKEFDEDDDLVNRLIEHSPEFQAFLVRQVEENKNEKASPIAEVRRRLLGE